MMTRLRLCAVLAATVAIIVAGFLNQAKAQQAQTDVVSRENVLRDPAVPVGGNRDAEFAIVEYFDYQCPYCKKIESVLRQIVEEDGKIRLVLKDWPIFGEASRYAAQMGLATKFQGKYIESHNVMIGARSKLSDQAVRELLKGAGIDVTRATADLQAHAQEINAVLERNDAQARAFGFPGTPAFIIGTFRVPGVLTAADFKQAIKDARAAAQK
jgi:protein-disulfide isomerase